MHPFTKAYWRMATLELKDLRMIVFAALMVSLRVALKAVSVWLAPTLQISLGFLPNALGAMVYGPVVALLTGVVTDTVGYLVAPSGPYFPWFMVTEMLASLIFALFLYKAKTSLIRVGLAKLCINVVCNMGLNTLFLMWMYGPGGVVAVMPRIVKNVLAFPIETALLFVLLGAVKPALVRLFPPKYPT